MPSLMSARALRAPIFRAMVPLLALATLSACGGQSGTGFAPACPQAGILKDGADVTTFQGTGTDLTDMVIDGRITGLSGKCALDDEKHLRTTITVAMDVTRGPALPGRRGTLTYFVSVMKGQTILDKKDYTLPVRFKENTDHIALTSNEVEMVLPVDDKTSGAAYRILVSYQLTPEQLAFNRRRGTR